MTTSLSCTTLTWAIALGCSAAIACGGSAATTAPQSDEGGAGSTSGDGRGAAGSDAGGVVTSFDGGTASTVDGGGDSGAARADAGGELAVRARTFTRTLGVELHLNNTGTPYATVTTVENALSYLNPNGIGTGISTVRDETLAYNAGITDVAGLGYELDIYPWYASPGSNSWSQQAPWLATISGTGKLRMLEGPLEVDNESWGIAVHSTTYTSNAGTTYSGWQAPVAWQEDLFAAYSASSTVVLFSLANPSDGVASSPAVAAASQLGTTISSVTSLGNVHYYPPNGYSPADAAGDPLTNVIQQETGYTPGLPFAITESGFTSIAGEGYQGNSYVNGVYTLDLILDAFRAGASLLSIYELFDESGIYPGSDQGGFGMFDASANPKDAATFMHNLLTVIGDSGATAATFTPSSLDFHVFGLMPPGRSLLLQKSDGAFELVVWSDASIFVGGTQTTAPTQNVTVTLGGSFGTVNVYAPTTGATPARTLSGASAVALAVTDAPQIIEVIP